MARQPLVARLNPLPVELTPALAGHRRRVAGRATGRVLDLGDWRDHLDAYDGDVVTSVDQAAEPDESDVSGPYDTIVSLVRTPLVADLPAYLDTLLGLLAPEGRLAFLEPVCRPGRGGRALAFTGRLGEIAGGLHLDRDLPRDLRAHGLVVADLHRFEVPTLSAPLRPFVEAWARRPITP